MVAVITALATMGAVTAAGWFRTRRGTPGSRLPARPVANPLRRSPLEESVRSYGDERGRACEPRVP